MKVCHIALSLVAIGAAWAQVPQGSRRLAPPERFGPGPNLERRLTQSLNLTAEQQNKVHTALEESRVQMQGMMQQTQSLRQSLAAAIKSGDENQIEKVSQELAAVQQQQTAIRAKSMAKIYAALTADQRSKLGPNLEMLMGPGRGRPARPANPQ